MGTALANRGLANPLNVDGIDTFSLGMISGSSPINVPQNGYCDALNTDLDLFAKPVTRRGANGVVGTGTVTTGVWGTDGTLWNEDTAYWSGGTTGPIIGLSFNEYNNNEYLFFADATASNNIWYKTATGNATQITSSTCSTANNAVWFAQLVNRLYFCDGSGVYKYVDLSSIGAAAATTAGYVTSIKVDATNGIYNAVPTITFTHNGGAAAAATAVLGYGGHVIAAKVTNQGSGYLAATPPTIAFGAPASGATATGTVRISQYPSKPKHLVTHTSRLFCATGDTALPPDTLYASDILDGDSWDLITNSIRIGGDGDPIVALHPWYRFFLIVFKERSVYIVDCDPTLSMAEWSVKLVNNRQGCVSWRSVATVGSDVVFQARDGLRSVRAINQGEQNDISEPISAPINDLILRINQSQLAVSAGIYYRNLYLLAVPMDSAVTPDKVLPFRAQLQSWPSIWSGWQPRCFAVAMFSGKPELYFGDQNGRIAKWSDTSSYNTETAGDYQDFGSYYESYLVGRAMNYGETFTDKLGVLAEFDYATGPVAPSGMTFSMFKDLSASETSLGSVTATANQRFARKSYNLTSKGKFNVAQFKIRASAGRWSLHCIKTAAVADSIKPEI